MQSSDTSVSPERLPVPAAKITFTPEDRQWIAERIAEVLETGRLTLGTYCKLFEERFAELCGRKHAISVNSGTSALEIILRAIDVRGRDVLVPTNTFFATAAAVVHAGGNVVLTDCDARGIAPTAAEIERRITSRTEAIVLVHIGGVISTEVAKIRTIARARGIRLIEDAAHAHGSSIDGTPAGAIGDAASFSFYPTKVMTSAEGGMIVTDDDEIDRQARIYRDQGKASFVENSHVLLGNNWRMSEPHAIIGLRHLMRLPTMLEHRRHIARIYDRELADVAALELIGPEPGVVGNGYKYIARVRHALDRNELRRALAQRFDVTLAGEVYQAPLHSQPVFSGLAVGGLAVAEDFCRRHVCLPISAEMTDAQAHHVVRAVRTLLER